MDKKIVKKKKGHYLQILEKCSKNKLVCFIPVRIAKSSKQLTANAGAGVGNRESLFTVGRITDS